MKTLFIDCGMGAAGDMLTAALLELFDNKDDMLTRLNSIGIPNVTFAVEKASKCGIGGTHMHVSVNGVEEGDEHSHDEHHHGHEHSHDDHHHNHDHSHDEHHHDHEHSHDDHHHNHEHGHEHGHHHHASMAEITTIIEGLNISDAVKNNVKKVYELIAEAESSVHGVPVTDIHFHEVGTMDAIADITAVCVLMEALDADRVVATPVHVGSGEVRCAHGVLPVPAPATANILRGIPIYGGQIRGELCTPTGAALLKTFVDEFGDMPVMNIDKIGYGVGKKDFERANILRVMVGNTAKTVDEVVTLECNLDDITPEKMGFAMEELLAAGAKDVFTTPLGMKKNRPGLMLSVICTHETKEKMVSLIFKHTTTLGIRETVHSRYILNRSVDTVNTCYGEMRVKRAEGYGVKREKYEYEDIARIAREQNISIDEVVARITATEVI